MFNKKNYLFSSSVPIFVLFSFFSVVNSQTLPKLYPVTKHSSDSYYFDGLKNSTKIYNDDLTISKFVLKTADKPGFQLIFNELVSALEADVTSSPGSCGDSTIKVKNFLDRYSKSENGKLIEFVSGASIAWWSNRKEKAADGIEEHLSYNHTAGGFIYKDKLFIVDLSMGQFASAYSRVVIMPYEFWLDAVGAVAKTNSFGQVYATKRIFTGTSLSLFEPPYYSDPKLN